MSVRVRLEPMLHRALDLYRMPRGRERFDAYVALGTSGTEQMQLPITLMNPMGKEHVLELLERAIALDAERIALAAATAAALKLPAVDDDIALAVIVADDLKGAWTNRAFSEFAHRYDRKYEVGRGWATVVLWTSEEPSSEMIAARAIETLYRTVDERRDGAVRALGEIMDREGRTQRFAGRAASIYDASTIDEIALTIEPLLGSLADPVIMASLYGDDVARSLGYRALGLPKNAGYELAIARACAEVAC